MTEKQWRVCEDPEAMIEWLDGASGRKFYLFACACCRRIDRLLTEPASREALAFVERHADVGLARRKGVAITQKAARQVWSQAYIKMFTFPDGRDRARCLVASNAADAVVSALDPNPAHAARFAAAFACLALAWEAKRASGLKRSADMNLDDSFKRPEQTEQARLLREIFGNPFRPASLDSGCRSADVVSLARAASDGLRQSSSAAADPRFAVLADALEEAGCTDEGIHTHLRGPGPHVRGCWVVDLVLGKS